MTIKKQGDNIVIAIKRDGIIYSTVASDDDVYEIEEAFWRLLGSAGITSNKKE